MLGSELPAKRHIGIRRVQAERITANDGVQSGWETWKQATSYSETASGLPFASDETVQTQIGVSTGNITTKGFDARIGINTDSFSDVFGQDANGNYFVKKADSPRLAVIPIAQDSTRNWPLSGNSTITVQGYVLVYIGDTTRPPSYPACSGSGNGLTVYLTPVSAALPDSWIVQFGDFTPGNPSPIVYRLVS